MEIYFFATEYLKSTYTDLERAEEMSMPIEFFIHKIVSLQFFGDESCFGHGDEMVVSRVKLMITEMYWLTSSCTNAIFANCSNVSAITACIDFVRARMYVDVT